MRLKNILLENENKRKFLKGCKTFIKKNNSQIKSENYLYRGTKSDYENSLIKKDYRERREIRGSKYRFYLYEKFKPKKFPERKSLVPSQNGKLNSLWSDRNVYTVFPIGSDYKLVYADEVYDFNQENPYMPEYTNERGMTDIDLQFMLHNLKWELKDSNPKMFKELNDILEDEIPKKPVNIMKTYNRYWNFIKKYENYCCIKFIKENFSFSDLIQVSKDLASDYFENANLAQKIPNMERLEVGIYAPDGFYYVKEELVKDIIK